MAKKLSNNSIDKIIKTITKPYEEVTMFNDLEGGEISFEVNWNTDIGKRMQSVMDGVSLAWNEDGEFMPALLSLAYTYALLSCFTNIKTEKIEKIYALSQLTNIIGVIESVLPERVYVDFKRDFEECFNYNKNKSLRLNNVDDISYSLGNLVSRFGSILENINPDTIDTLLNTDDGEAEPSLTDKEE